MHSPSTLWYALSISLGASAGALLRWRLALWFNSPGMLLPWGTLLANLLGGYLIGLAVATLQALPQLDPAWRLLIITGFLGGLTTFSTFSMETMDLLLQQRYVMALLLTGLHLLGSLAMTWLGLQSFGLFVAR